MSSYYCTDCKDVNIFGPGYCGVCGKKLITLPVCNWCHCNFWPNFNFCKRCGRSRSDALTTSPLPYLSRIRKRMHDYSPEIIRSKSAI